MFEQKQCRWFLLQDKQVYTYKGLKTHTGIT